MNRTFHLGRNNRKILGVCSGLANYFDIDPMLVRIGWVAATLFFGVSIIFYIVIGLVAD